MSATESSYVALRAVRGHGTGAWWAAARASRDVPPPVAGLLHGRTRVELNATEAEAVLAWAATVDGWAGSDPKPLLPHPEPDA
jgi:hypothetical protein